MTTTMPISLIFNELTPPLELNSTLMFYAFININMMSRKPRDTKKVGAPVVHHFTDWCIV
jgi:hypothetical protein